MTSNIFHMSINEMGTALGIGALCALVYLNLLWQTVHLLPRVQHKGLFLFISVVLRIFLLLAVMVLLSDNKAGRFILIFCGFVIGPPFLMIFVFVYPESSGIRPIG